MNNGVSTAGRAATAVELTRLVWGGALLLAPDTVLRAAGAGPSRLARTTARTLGARQLLSAAATAATRRPPVGPSTWPSPGPVVAGVVAGVDAIHAVSAVAFAAATDAHRAWLLDAVAAAAFAGLTWRTAP